MMGLPYRARSNSYFSVKCNRPVLYYLLSISVKWIASKVNELAYIYRTIEKGRVMIRKYWEVEYFKKCFKVSFNLVEFEFPV